MGKKTREELVDSFLSGLVDMAKPTRKRESKLYRCKDGSWGYTVRSPDSAIGGGGYSEFSRCLGAFNAELRSVYGD